MEALIGNPASSSAPRDRAAMAEELRRLLPRLEGSRPTRTLPFGLAAIDRHLPHGGLSGGALHEIVPVPGTTAAAFGFMAALCAQLTHPAPPPEKGRSMALAHDPAKWKPVRREDHAHRVGVHQRPLFLVLPSYGGREHGRPSGHGLSTLGLDPNRVILVETANRKETLWAIDEAVRSAAPAAVAGMIDKLDLKSSQRLHLAAGDAGVPAFLLRPAPTLESSAAATRWRVGTAEAARDRFGLFARASWHLILERCRNGRPGEWVVEYDHVAHRFGLSAALADHAFSRRAGGARIGQAV